MTKANTGNSSTVVSLSKGRGSSAQWVTVGVSARLGPPARRAHFKWTKGRHVLRLEAASSDDDMNAGDRLFLGCMIACVVGVESIRRLCHHQFECEFTVLEGKNLHDDYTVGFSVAAAQAVAVAVGFNSQEQVETLKHSGWSLHEPKGN